MRICERGAGVGACSGRCKCSSKCKWGKFQSQVYTTQQMFCAPTRSLSPFFIFATVAPLPHPPLLTHLQLIARLIARRCACATLSCCCCCCWCCTSQKGRRPSLLAGQHTALGTRMYTVASKMLKRITNLEEPLQALNSSYRFYTSLYKDAEFNNKASITFEACLAVII